MRSEGIITRAVGGFYFVRTGDRAVRCRARGRFRKDGLTPLVGDRVVVECSGMEGTVVQLLPRRNAFRRPTVANVDCLVMILSAARPVTDPYLADRVTVRCEKNGCGVMLVINKCDLNRADELYRTYAATCYPILRVSAVTGEGIASLREAMAGKICCFTGNSGVGKSSIINALSPGLSIPTGEISEKLGRGRHTTRHVEFFDIGGETLVGDTPGFASFGEEMEILISAEELADLFPDFALYTHSCRFDDCTHRSEPGCTVRTAVEAGYIAGSRYNSYLRLYEEISQRQARKKCDGSGRKKANEKQT